VITLIRCVASRTRWQVLAPLVAFLALTAAISGCGSAGHSGASAARRRACQDVSAVLSDGPDSQAAAKRAVSAAARRVDSFCPGAAT
jgi:hypothetical protein